MTEKLLFLKEKIEEYAKKHYSSEIRAIGQISRITEAHHELSFYEKVLVFKYSKDIDTVEAVNEKLQKGEYSEFGEHLEFVLSKLPSYEGIVYRGCRLTKNQLDQYKEGETITFPDFSSSSRSWSIAYQFCENCMFSIFCHTQGKPIERLAKFGEGTPQNEKEVLFLPGTSFHVLEVTNKDNYTLIRLEEIYS